MGLSPPWVCPSASWAMPGAELGAWEHPGLTALQARLVRGRTVLFPRGQGCLTSAHGPQGWERGWSPSPKPWPPSRGPHQAPTPWESTARRGSPWAAWLWWQGDAVVRQRSRPCPQPGPHGPRRLSAWGRLGTARWGEGASGHRKTFSLPPPDPIGAVSHAGVTPGVPDSQPRQRLPPGWGKVRSIPHSQGDRGKL